jgi:hypothetical protein
MCGVRPLWSKTKELLDDFYGSVTLEMIAKEEKEAKGFMVSKNLAPVRGQ